MTDNQQESVNTDPSIIKPNTQKTEPTADATEKKPESCTAILLSMALGAALVLGANHYRQHPNYFTRTDVAAGYVDPRKCEFSKEDIEQKGEYRTVLRYDNKPYLLVKTGDKIEARPYTVHVEGEKEPEKSPIVSKESLSSGSTQQQKQGQDEQETPMQKWERVEQEQERREREKAGKSQGLEQKVRTGTTTTAPTAHDEWEAFYSKKNQEKKQ